MMFCDLLTQKLPNGLCQGFLHLEVLPHLEVALNDNVLSVRVSAAWTLAHICVISVLSEDDGLERFNPSSGPHFGRSDGVAIMLLRLSLIAVHDNDKVSLYGPKCCSNDSSRIREHIPILASGIHMDILL